MASLHIIDQSLTGKGGHHFDYVCCLLEAAESHEVPATLGTHRTFRAKSLSRISFRDPIVVSPCFRNTTYQKVSWLAGLRHLKRGTPTNEDSDGKSGLAKTLHSLSATRLRRVRRKLIANFAADMRDYFKSLGVTELTASDHIFLTTVSELELMGLAIFLSTTPWTKAATWHLQFHYNLYEGRSPEYDSQAATLKKVRGCFLAALSRIPGHCLNFYCTTDELVRQYDELRAVQFQKLVYPVDPRFTADTAIAKMSAVEIEDRPIQIVCPGELRREKGHTTSIQPLVENVWEDLLSPGKAQLSVQRPNRNWPRKQKLELELPGGGQNQQGEPSVNYLAHPLPKEDYVSLIQNADVGVLFHDARAYFSRRAGVLGELLCCGKPVIVPAGCWLSRQISRSQFSHLEGLSRELRRSRSLGLGELNYDSSNVPLAGGKVSFDSKKHPFSVSFEATAEENLAMVWFKWHDPVGHGVDAAIELIADGKRVKKIVGHRDHRDRVGCLFRLPELNAGHYEIRFANAFHDSTATVTELSVELYQTDDPFSIPESAVGLSASDTESYASGLREICLHFEHYRDTAQRFARSLSESQHPSMLLQQLTGLPWQTSPVNVQRIA